VERDDDDVRDRYDRLHNWRKTRAQARGVESDVILPRTTLRDLAQRPPSTLDELVGIIDFGPRRREVYGDEILSVVAGPTRRTGAVEPEGATPAT
jgi:ribonuclease D